MSNTIRMEHNAKVMSFHVSCPSQDGMLSILPSTFDSLFAKASTPILQPRDIVLGIPSLKQRKIRPHMYSHNKCNFILEYI